MLLVQGQAYRQQYGMNVVHLLPVNLYGPRDNFDPALLPRDPRAHQEGARTPWTRATTHIEVWGTGQGVARVPLRGGRGARHLPWPRRATSGAEPVNLGAGFEITIRDLAELDRAAHGLRRARSAGTPTSPTGSRAAASTPSRAERLFGFRATTGFEDGLRRTIEWYRKRALVADARALNDPLLEEVRRFYEENHEGHRGARGDATATSTTTSTRVLRARMPAGQRVLDLGCGSGHLLAALQPSRGVGIDVSARAVAAARTDHAGREPPLLRGRRRRPPAARRSSAGPSTRSCSSTWSPT